MKMFHQLFWKWNEKVHTERSALQSSLVRNVQRRQCDQGGVNGM